MKELVIIGDKEVGKTTLANALLISVLKPSALFPQSYDDIYIPTEACDSRMLTENVRLTDTPGYSLLWDEVPEAVTQAVSKADTLIVLLSEEMAEEDIDIPTEDPEWEACRAEEETLLETLLEGKTRDIYFVITYDAREWPYGQVPLTQALRLARARFSRFSVHGEAGFFCIDPMKALIGDFELDAEAVTQSGILPLKAALQERGLMCGKP